MKVSELSGVDLDYWVAQAEGHRVRVAGDLVVFYEGGDDSGLKERRGPIFSPSTDWRDGGPIIEREGIVLLNYSYERGTSCAFLIGADSYIDVHGSDPESAGPTHLIAAMRAYVTLKFGEEVQS